MEEVYTSYEFHFTMSVKEIDKQFFKGNGYNGMYSLKDWVDSFQGTRFTPIKGKKAIITTHTMIEDLIK
ncbi:MAG: hypothetical protein LUF04_00345, partial [Bacteroides sp.]|nr:hypothetical protein [Bacteroides sp.]